MKKKHKHIWYQTTMASDMPNHISYACNCGQWRVETFGLGGEWKLKDIKIR